MMIPLETYLRRGRNKLEVWLRDARVRLWLREGIFAMAGFLLSAAALFHGALPLSMGLVLGCSGWSAALVTAGSSLGYLYFWGSAGYAGILWVVAALLITLLVSDRTLGAEAPLLPAALAGMVVSGVGVVLQIWLGDDTPVALYILRVALAVGTGWLFPRVLKQRDPILEWISCGLCVLALAQVEPVIWMNFGIMAGAVLTVMGAFPAAALAGVALDISGITPISMTAILCGSYLIRYLPRYPRWLGGIAPTMVGMLLMSMNFTVCPEVIPPLFLGGFFGVRLPGGAKGYTRKGETGIAQVRLELASVALTQARQLLMETRETPVDTDSLILRAVEQACGGCPCRNSCRDCLPMARLPGSLLRTSLLSPRDLPVVCRKSTRVLSQLHQAQEQLRAICADRQRQQEYREAVIQQYRFLSGYLQGLSDQLGRHLETGEKQYLPHVEIYANRAETENGDRVVQFPGVGCLYYVILCDGMGSGLGAVQEAATAQLLLRRLLTAGFPAEHALQSLNSLCALRGRAGAATVDLVQLHLDTGRAQLYKWGAMPSYVISRSGAEKIGTAGPPPGISLEHDREKAYQLSLRRGETLVLVSDGVGEEDALHCCLNMEGSTPGELARSLLTCSQYGGEDDATVVLVQLGPGEPEL